MENKTNKQPFPKPKLSTLLGFLAMVLGIKMLELGLSSSIYVFGLGFMILSYNGLAGCNGGGL